MTDPTAVAKGFIEAFNARDLQRLLPLVGQANLDAVKAALVEGPNGPAYNSIFAPEVMDVLSKEQGKIEGPRYDRKDAVYRVADAGRGDVHVIVLDKGKDGRWLIEEFNTISAEKFTGLPDKPKK